LGVDSGHTWHPNSYDEDLKQETENWDEHDSFGMLHEA
jgi:hypothetical protein